MSALAPATSPDAEQLESKLNELASLEQELTSQELYLSTCQAGLNAFKKRYHHTVGTKYAELDEIKAQILEMTARFFPQQKKTQEQAHSAREQADQAEEETREEIPATDEEIRRFDPSEDLRKLFREVAKKIHPDLTTDEQERQRRHELMARLNRAYDELDEAAIRDVLTDWEAGNRPDRNASVSSQLIKTIRKIKQVRDRLHTLNEEIESIENSEMHQLRERIEQAEKEGRDVMGEMVADIDRKIETIKSRVQNLAENVFNL